MKVYLFTYGSLMKGRSNHNYLKAMKAKYISDGILNNIKLYDCVKSVKSGRYKIKASLFPLSFEDVNGCTLIGEVYEINKEHIDFLDYFESEGVLYNRRIKEVKMPDGNTIECYVYIGNKETWKNSFDDLIPCNKNEKYQQRYYW